MFALADARIYWRILLISRLGVLANCQLETMQAERTGTGEMRAKPYMLARTRPPRHARHRTSLEDVLCTMQYVVRSKRGYASSIQLLCVQDQVWSPMCAVGQLLLTVYTVRERPGRHLGGA